MGCSIKQYYLSNVMHYAHTIRRQRSLNTSELARRCGYSTAQNFLLAYKKYFSLHPQESSGTVKIWQGSNIRYPIGAKHR